jgi:uncharacterized membrane protein
VALVIVTILTVYVVALPIIPSSQEKFSELGVLGPTGNISDYPTLVTSANNSFTLYGYVGNHEGAVQYYQVVSKLGNNATIVSNSTSANAPIIGSYAYVLNNNQNVTFPMRITIDTNGTDLRLIFELWDYNMTTSSFDYTGLWNQIWLNATV